MRFSTVFTAILVAGAAAHPGHDLSEEITERRAFKRVTRRNDLSHCAAKLEARGIEKRNLMRRASVANLRKRDLETDLATDHNNTSNGYSIYSPASSLFASNNSCILTPEVTNGPYCKNYSYLDQC